MIKIVAAVRRKPGMTHSEFLNYIEHKHGQLARGNPLGLSRYVQNHVFDSAFGADTDPTYTQAFHRDSVTELFFADVSQMIRTMSDPHTQQKTGPDALNFADMSNQIAQLMDESEIPVQHPGTGALKIMIFLKKLPDVPLERFFLSWNQAHDAIAAEQPIFGRAVRRQIHSRYLPEGDKITSYFGPDIQVSQGVSSLWFEHEADSLTFRAYQRSLFQRLTQEGVLDTSGSFFVYAKEVVILDQHPNS